MCRVRVRAKVKAKGCLRSDAEEDSGGTKITKSFEIHVSVQGHAYVRICRKVSNDICSFAATSM